MPYRPSESCPLSSSPSVYCEPRKIFCPVALTFLWMSRPQYWDIWKRREVVGISYTFMVVDISGGVFSLLSLAFKAKFDTIASITYALVVVRGQNNFYFSGTHHSMLYRSWTASSSLQPRFSIPVPGGVARRSRARKARSRTPPPTLTTPL